MSPSFKHASVLSTASWLSMYVRSVYVTCVLPRALSHVLVIWQRNYSGVGPGVWGFDPGNILSCNITRMQGVDGGGGG